MLWRAGYDTRELPPTPFPELVATSLVGSPIDFSLPCVLSGGFDPRAQMELGVWDRLLHEIELAIPHCTVFLLERPIEKAEASIIAMTPRSRWATVGLAACTEPWQELIQPDRPSRSFAGILVYGMLHPLMVGLPTEEAWDRFRQSAAGYRN